ncbi:MAG TPA: AI-2E family transporter [Microthrixaceae bacterium]|nr:AI-2E family transporter [Microthrixaceae bacterium]
MSDPETPLPPEKAGSASRISGGEGGTVHGDQTSEQGLPEDALERINLSTFAGGQQLPRWFWRSVVAIAFSVAVFMLARGILERLESLIRVLIISLFLSFALEPVVNRLAKRGWKRGRATLVCFLVVFGVGGVFVGVMVSLVVTQTSDLVKHAPGYVNEATDWINDTFDTEITSVELNDTIKKYQKDLTALAADLGGRVLSVTGTAVGAVFQVFTVFLFSYYMISEGPQMRRGVCSLLPERRQAMVLRLWELSVDKTGGWVFSRLLLALVSSTCSWIIFMILGVPSPLALALWMGLISQFIPVVGTYLGGFVPLLVALMNNPIDALWVLIWIIVYQQIENYLLSPRITAHTMDLHPAVAFGSALAGASLFGAVGAILALPAAAVIQAFVSSYLNRHDVIETDLTYVDAD